MRWTSPRACGVRFWAPLRLSALVGSITLVQPAPCTPSVRAPTQGSAATQIKQLQADKNQTKIPLNKQVDENGESVN